MMANPTATMAMPLTVSGRAPTRSASRPARGATMPKASGIAINSSPERAVPRPCPRSKKNGTSSKTPNITR